MGVEVRLSPVLRSLADGAAVLEAEVPDGSALSAVLAWLDAEHPAIGRRVRDEQGAIRRHVNVFVGPDNQRDLQGLDTVVPVGVEVAILPAVSGGA